MIDVKVINGELSDAEKQAYIKRAHELYPGIEISSMDIVVDSDYVDIAYHFAPVKFQRIRRITGYLVGTLDRFNDAKLAEVHDRVKHDLGGTDG